MKRAPAPKPAPPAHYGDLRASATAWWALQRARVRLTQAAIAAKKAGWGTPEDHLSVGLKALAKEERAAARVTVEACAAVYPVIAQLVEQTDGLGDAVALFCGLVPPLMRLEEFPGFPNPTALWAYSGLSAERREKCDRRARMIAIAYMATPAIIRSPDFHGLYTWRRGITAGRGWTKMHAHRDATRFVAKRILKYLWLCRLPVRFPQESLPTAKQITAAGAAPLVASPSDTLALLENPHGDEAPAVLPSVASPSNALEAHHSPDGGRASASERDAQPHSTLAPQGPVSAPESDASPDTNLSPDGRISTPEPDASPATGLRPVLEVSAPESDARPSVALRTNQLISAPGPDVVPAHPVRSNGSLSAPESDVSPVVRLAPKTTVSAPESASSPQAHLLPVLHVSTPGAE